MTRHIERSGPAVRAALQEFSPQECVLFVQQFQQALLDTGQQYDIGPVEAVLDRWWPIAAIRANPLSPAEQDLVARARNGDDTGWAASPAAAAVAEPAQR